MSWSTPSEAETITGDALTQAQLDRASIVLEINVGVTEDALDKMKPRDVRLLKYAEAYQAAWMAAQVDYTGRSDADLVDQDGLSFSKGDPDMHILAPLAKRCIKQLSWKGTKTMSALTPGQALVLRNRRTAETMSLYGDSGSFDFEDEDTDHWKSF